MANATPYGLEYPPFDLPSSSTVNEFQSYILKLVKPLRKNPLKLSMLGLWLEETLEKAQFSKSRVFWAKKVIRDYSKPKKEEELEISRSCAYTEREEYIDPLNSSASVPPVYPISGNLGGYPKNETLANLRSKMDSLLLVTDPTLLDATLGLAATHDLEIGRPVWGVLVGPPSSGKNEYIDLLNTHPRVHPMGDLTAKTWISGLDKEDAKGGKEPSLLCKYPHHIFTFKDWTTLLSADPHRSSEIFGQFVHIYDGAFPRDYGTGEEIAWRGHATILAGVTHLLYKHYALMGKIGPRFLVIQPTMPNAEQAAMFALEVENEDILRDELKELTKQIFLHLPLYYPEVDKDFRNWLVQAATFLTVARHPLDKDNEGNVSVKNPVEGPGRVSKELKKYAQGIARLNLRPIVGSDEKAIIKRTVFDTVPPWRMHLLGRMLETRDITPAKLVENNLDISLHKVYSTLDELRVLGMIVGKGMDGTDYGKTWNLTDETREKLEKVHTL